MAHKVRESGQEEAQSLPFDRNNPYMPALHLLLWRRVAALERDRAELIEALRSLLVALVKTGDNARVEHGQNAAFVAARALLSRLEKDRT